MKSDTRQWDVFMESFVCIELPADVDPDSEEGTELLYRKAAALYVERIRSGQCEFTWEEFHEE